MAVPFGDNIQYLGKKPLDRRQKYETVSEMSGMADNTLPDGIIAYCVETDKTYQWKSVNTVDATLGRWREFATGSVSDVIEYVDQLPTDNIKNIIYGIKETTGKTTTITLIKPMAGQLSKEQAIDYFSQYFIVTDIDNNTIGLSVYPDLVLSRDLWSRDYKAADGDIVTLNYLVDEQEFSWTNSLSQETSTGAWTINPIHCTSAYFPTYKYYAGVEDTQELNEIGAGGSADIDNDTIVENQYGELSVSPAYKKIFGGTEEEFLELDVEERKKYDYIAGSDNNEIGLWPKAPTTPTAVYENLNSSSNIDYTYTVTERAFYLVRLHSYSEGQSHAWGLYLNGVQIGAESSYSSASGVGATMTLPCNVGDTIRMSVTCGGTGTYDKRNAAIYKL